MDKDSGKKSLLQRIIELQKIVGDVEPSSENQYKKAALGIYDVARAIREPLTKVGIVVIPSQARLQDQSPAMVQMDKNTWRVTLAIDIYNADDREDMFHVEWSDTGANPAAAISFARKSWLKALLNLAEKDEEGQPEPIPAPAPTAPPDPMLLIEVEEMKADFDRLLVKLKGLHGAMNVSLVQLRKACYRDMKLTPGNPIDMTEEDRDKIREWLARYGNAPEEINLG